jgi:hypothetical protein
MDLFDVLSSRNVGRIDLESDKTRYSKGKLRLSSHYYASLTFSSSFLGRESNVLSGCAEGRSSWMLTSSAVRRTCRVYSITGAAHSAWYISTPLSAVAIRSISNSMTVSTVAIPLKHENIGHQVCETLRQSILNWCSLRATISFKLGQCRSDCVRSQFHRRKILLTTLDWQPGEIHIKSASSMIFVSPRKVVTARVCIYLTYLKASYVPLRQRQSPPSPYAFTYPAAVTPIPPAFKPLIRSTQPLKSTLLLSAGMYSPLAMQRTRIPRS